jgi:23S rRNA pseudouridine2605 synthase
LIFYDNSFNLEDLLKGFTQFMDNTQTKKRLSKVMAAAGVASRRACEELIFASRVTVNGTIVLLPQTLVGLDDKIVVDGNTIGTSEPKVYYILNKPAGYVCTAKKTNTTPIVLDLFEDCPYRVFTIGRLDKDTEGLMLVTNDGHFANEVIHPSADIHKEYLAKTDAEVSADHLTAISNGTLVEGIFVKPIRVSKVRRGTLKITISEGKKREVRLLLEAAGLQIKELCRIRIGGLHLGTLAPGAWRPLTEREKALIFE